MNIDSLIYYDIFIYLNSIKRRLGDHWICGETWIILERTLLLFMLQAVGIFSNRIPGKDCSGLLAFWHVCASGLGSEGLISPNMREHNVPDNANLLRATTEFHW